MSSYLEAIVSNKYFRLDVSKTTTREVNPPPSITPTEQIKQSFVKAATGYSKPVSRVTIKRFSLK